ncbi:class I SAM-dependent methyltransferase [Amycolatopsis sp. Poz14]|uniref:class I SAM-dependent methyltransferase n=1 Tax=Amycolatopsis sp. Poz14 TaxID=1447705 RepID=UPI001EE8D95E|nr:class I SAM-dependent methyltransferase [Amycolatopsis sp. Poz14]MCG3750390.1 class I SAM-dependent methyltransferase [Amycolatopsis sp. Poz14]
MNVLERALRWWGPRGGIAQFHRPTGIPGHVAGLIMGRRSSNVTRNRWAVRLLDIQPSERVLELGCGPGVAVAALADRAALVVGVDHSSVMIRQARHRNWSAVRAGRVRLMCASVENLAFGEGLFDAALAVNTMGMWPEPVARLRELARLLRPGGRIALVSQPRQPGVTSAAVVEELTGVLAEAGFSRLRTEMLDLDPPVVCVLAVSD